MFLKYFHFVSWFTCSILFLNLVVGKLFICFISILHRSQLNVQLNKLRHAKKKKRDSGIKSYFNPNCNRSNGSNWLKSIAFLQELDRMAFQSLLITHESLYSYFSDCLMLCNDTMQWTFAACWVLSNTITNRPTSYFVASCISLAFLDLRNINEFVLFINSIKLVIK